MLGREKGQKSRLESVIGFKYLAVSCGFPALFLSSCNRQIIAFVIVLAHFLRKTYLAMDLLNKEPWVALLGTM